MKKSVLAFIVFSILTIVTISMSTSVYAEANTKPNYAVNKGGYITCTVADNNQFKEASTITWGNSGKKKCDEIVIKEGSTITVSEEINLGDKLLTIGDEQSTTLEVTTGGKITFDEEGTIQLGDYGILKVISGGIVDGKDSIFGTGENNTGKIIVDGANSKINIHDNTAELGIFGLNIEVNNQGTIEVSKMSAGIEVTENNSLTINGGKVITNNNNTYGISGNLNSNNGEITANNNKNYGLKLKAGSTIGGNTNLTSTGNSKGDLALTDKNEGEVIIADNASVTIDSISKGNDNNKTTLKVNGDGSKLNYSSSEEGLVKVINSTVTTAGKTIRYADHDIEVDETTTVVNTSNSPIKVKTSDMKDNTGITLESNSGEQTIEVLLVEINGKNYRIIKGVSKDDLNIPVEEINNAMANPNTSDINLYLLLGLIAVSGCGIAYIVKRRFN